MGCDSDWVDPSIDLFALASESGWVGELSQGLIVPVTVTGSVVAELVPAGHLPRRARQLVEVRRATRDQLRSVAASIEGGHCVALRLDGRLVGLMRPVASASLPRRLVWRGRREQGRI